jgi:hypothetical protein
VRDKVMFRNALMFYRRHVPNGHEHRRLALNAHASRAGAARAAGFALA